MTKMKKTETTPSIIALCIKLARRNHMCGVLLYRIKFWGQYSHAIIPGVEGVWTANDRAWWMRDAQISSDQYDRSIARLEKWGLIERRQWWFGRRNILFVRATKATFDYISAATTWQAAEDFAVVQSDHPETSESAEHCSANSLSSNGISNNQEPGAAMLLISNNMENLHGGLKHKKLNSPPPASPSWSKEQIFAKEVSGEHKAIENGVSNLNELIAIWAQTMKDHGYSDSVSLCAKEMGLLASLYSNLSGGPGEEDFQDRAGDIISYAIKHWPNLKTCTTCPTMNSLKECFGVVVASWDKAGRPSCCQK